ncbi:hypothetical protein RhiirB3_396665 [Rhizophagus irregularis]|nr:hypothetical protein RhiirB3_396665 [Rhizophagus irregularis]
MEQFENTWAVLCTGHYLRVCLAFHSSDQRAIRRAHVALLAGLPQGSVAADLSEIAKEVSAKSVNIPFSYNSYNPKPYAYVHFSFAATKESAMGITCALKSIGLTLGMNLLKSPLFAIVVVAPVVIWIDVLHYVLLNVSLVRGLAMINCVNYIINTYLPLIPLNTIIVLRVLIIPGNDLMLMLLVEELPPDPSSAPDLPIHALNIIIIVVLIVLLNLIWIMTWLQWISHL